MGDLLVRKRYAVILCLMVIVLICIWYLISNQADHLDVASDNISKPQTRMMAYGNYKVREFLEEAIRAFEEQDPSFSISLEVVPSSFNQNYFAITGYIPDYEQKLLLEFAAGDPPDVFFIPKARGEIYRESGALLDISPYINSDIPQYGLQVGMDLLGIAQGTKNASESIALLKFLHNYTFEYENEFKAAFLDESRKMPDYDGNILEASLEDFLKMWNQVALSKNLDKLIVFPSLFMETEEGWSYNFYQRESGPGLWVSVTLSPDTGSIITAAVSMHCELYEDPEMIGLYKQCIINLIEVVDPEARIQGPDKILKGLGADDSFSSLDFLNMIGSMRYNGVTYFTFGPDGLGHDSYGFFVQFDDTLGNIMGPRRYLTRPSE